jgi:hypothetical protein
MKNSLNALLLTAALSGLAGGTVAAAQSSHNGSTKISSSNAAVAGVRLVGQDKDKGKHS